VNAQRPVRLASGRAIGPGQPCFLVAEIGNNHQGDEATARRMIEAAAAAGADAVKFQKRDVRALLTGTARRAPYTGPNSFGPTYGAHRQALELPLEALARLKAHAQSLGLVFFASAWDAPSLDGLAALGVELLKIASADLPTLPLLRRAGALGLPVALSTGMSTLDEIAAAVAELQARGAPLILLHCNSSYPCPPEDAALPVLPLLARRFGLPVGYSGHEAGLAPSLGAVALGACMLERHFTLDRTLPGTDHQASLDPEGFARLAGMVRELEAAMRVTAKTVTPAERATAAKLRKSVVAARPLAPGTVLGPGDLAVKCPGTGLSPLHWDELPGRVLLRALEADEPLAWDDLAPEAGRAAGNGGRP
jgi:N-acetylneuraminate synthase/sialic acid synthase